MSRACSMLAAGPRTRSIIIWPAVMRWQALMEVSSGSGSWMLMSIERRSAP